MVINRLFSHKLDDNTFIGIYSGYDVTTGGQNTVVGRGGLGNNQSGNSNTIMGYQALLVLMETHMMETRFLDIDRIYRYDR